MTMQNRPYAVMVEPAARRVLNKLPRQIQVRIISRIESLSANPRPPGAIKLSGHDAYRIRVGDYRVVYSVIDTQLLVIVVTVGNRRDVYRDY